MWRTQSVQKTFVNIKDNDKGYPQFVIQWVNYSWLDWILTYIKTEKKEIVPTTGPNAGKTVTLKNLVIGIEEEEGNLELAFPLYWPLARTILNSLAWSDELWKVYLSVYKNKSWFRCISVKKNNQAENARYTPFYTYDEEQAMVWTKSVQWEDKKDYDVITDRYLKELLPIIEDKIKKQVPLDLWDDELFWKEETPIVDKMREQDDDNEDLPF